MVALLDDPRLADMKDALPNFPRTRRILDPSDPPKAGESRYLLFHDEDSETFGRLSWENEPQRLSFISHTGHGEGFGRLTERPRIKEKKRRPKSRVDVWDFRLWLVASAAFVEVLRRFDPEAVETLDIDWSFVDGETLDGYVFLDIRRRIHAYDYARSRAVVEMEKGRKLVAWLAHPRALQPDIDPSIHVFRDAYWRHDVFVSRAVAQALVEAGLRGFRFEDPVSVATVELNKPKRAKKPVAPVPTPRAADNQWLVDLAEANDEPVMRVQGLLVDSIVIAQETFDDVDPYAVIQATIDVANDLMLDAGLLPGEFPQQALWAYYVDYYRAQVAEGGTRSSSVTAIARR
jgi:hypothetical protein